jgi:RNA polymerase-binding transcription factor DksA
MQEHLRYSDNDLNEFEALLLKKLEIAQNELESYKAMLNGKTAGSSRISSGGNHSLESGAESAQKEEINTLAARQKKYIISLENALIRIKNKTYGICFKSDKLIAKARLLAVPTTTQSIEEKLKQY